jgi:FeS assembly protein IscX
MEGESSLSWDDSFAIARALSKSHPDVSLEKISLMMIFTWTIALPEFNDDPELANDNILAAIFQEWYEEVTSL